MADTTVAPPRCPDTPAQQAQERTTRGLLVYNRERGRIHRLYGDTWAVPSSQGGALFCRKYARHCAELRDMHEEALQAWARAETLEAVRRAWASLGGHTTLHRYGREHFVLLARHRHGDPEALPLLVARMQRRSGANG